MLRRTACRQKPDNGRIGFVTTSPVTRAAAVAVLVLHAVVAPAQDVTEAALKAAFIYNFARFTEWPADALAPAAPLVMCVAGDAAISEALDKNVRGRDHGGHRIVVRRLDELAPTGGCHLLYVTRHPPADVERALAPLRGQPLLTISDAEGFTRTGGIALFYFERAQLRFYVDTDNLRKSRLEISSRLLQLSKRP